jgi:RNA polymerase sigma-70 factor (ECF subfamily)
MTDDPKTSLPRRVRRAFARWIRPTTPMTAQWADPGTVHRLKRALDSMHEMERAVFERVRFGDQDYSQIAAELGLSVREVERHFAAALLHIWRVLDREDGR